MIDGAPACYASTAMFTLVPTAIIQVIAYCAVRKPHAGNIDCRDVAAT